MNELDFLFFRRALDGMAWRQMARTLGVSDRMLRYWRKGRWPAPAWLPLALEGLVQRRRTSRPGRRR